MLLETINKNFKGSYDFFYLPIDFKVIFVAVIIIIITVIIIMAIIIITNSNISSEQV